MFYQDIISNGWLARRLRCFLSLSISIGKLATIDGCEPLALLFIASIGSGLLLKLICSLNGYTIQASKQSSEYMIVTAITFSGTNSLSLIVADKVGVAYMSLMFSLPLVMTWLMSVAIGKTQFNYAQILATLICISGVFFLLMNTGENMRVDTQWAYFAILVPLIISFGNLYRTARWPHNAHPIQLSASMLVASSIPTLVFMFIISENTFDKILFILTRPDYLALQVLVYSALYFLFFITQKISGPVSISLIGIVATIVGVVTSVFLIGERLTHGAMISLVSILASSIIFIRAQKRYEKTGN